MVVSESRDGTAMVARFASMLKWVFRTGKEKKEKGTEFRMGDRESLAHVKRKD